MTKYLSDKERPHLEAAVSDLIERARLYRSCLTCQHFTEGSEVCGLAGGRPPARVIAMGCPQYLEEPPF